MLQIPPSEQAAPFAVGDPIAIENLKADIATLDKLIIDKNVLIITANRMLDESIATLTATADKLILNFETDIFRIKGYRADLIEVLRFLTNSPLHRNEQRAKYPVNSGPNTVVPAAMNAAGPA